MNNEYTCKFERESKPNPTDWIIVNNGSGCKLVYIGDKPNER